MSSGIQVSEEFFKKFGKRFPPESFLCKEGDEGQTMFFIKSGKVAIIKSTPAGDKVLATLKDGDFFGEMALMGAQEIRAATVKSVTEVAVLELNRMAFEGLIRRSPEIAMKVISSLTGRVRDANSKLSALIHKNDFVRIATYLASLAASGKKTDPNGDGRVFLFNPDAAAQVLGVDKTQMNRFLTLGNKVKFLARNGEWMWIPVPGYLPPFGELLEKATEAK
ncbi:cyclic nucleotide-binding domain-containing protein [bacterium]|nr:cyclic nucleotide-binding domain-containing protein [bacterium]